ncbi:hypothetical protein D3C72_1868690 [compost metagenome]
MLRVCSRPTTVLFSLRNSNVRLRSRLVPPQLRLAEMVVTAVISLEMSLRSNEAPALSL